jgi:NADH-quinone oxidoreductase subunit C
VNVIGPDVRAGHVAELARARFGGAVLRRAEAQKGEDVIGVPRELLLELLAFFRDDRDLFLGHLLDVTCVDRYEPRRDGDEDRDDGGDDEKSARPERFLVVYRLKSPRLGYRARVLVEVPEHDAVVPSVTGLYPAADWHERELWDLFGVYPDGHPHLRRLVLYEGFSGHPLRRDYPATKAQPLVPLRSLPAPAVASAPDPRAAEPEEGG